MGGEGGFLKKKLWNKIGVWENTGNALKEGKNGEGDLLDFDYNNVVSCSIHSMQ